MKEDLKKKAKDAELKLVQSLFRWKYKREGRPVPGEEELEKRSRIFTEKVQGTISRRGGNIWKELKNAYEGKKEDKKD
ncbi:MAG: hypothetical protein JRJ03_16050 [Deltaproteobacteria bacterium]|nr:hypothetical protein [Deltaproteobacteria bacterium]